MMTHGQQQDLERQRLMEQQLKPEKLMMEQLLSLILINATSSQIGVFQINILSEFIRIKQREYVGQLAK